VNVAEQAIWTLGNIAGDCDIAEERNIVLKHGVVDHLLDFVYPKIEISFLRIVVWLISNLCRNKHSDQLLRKFSN